MRDPSHSVFCFFSFHCLTHLGFSGFIMFIWGKVVSFIDIWSFLDFTFSQIFLFLPIFRIWEMSLWVSKGL